MSKAESSGSKQDIAHDAKTHLAVLTMGLELLKKNRNEPERFDEMLDLIRRDGLEPLRALVLNLLSHTDGNARHAKKKS